MRFGEILAEPVRNGIYKKKEFHGRGCRMVNMGELFAYGFISDQEMKRVELNAKERSKYLLQDGDLLFARRSLVLEGSGKCSLVVNPSEPTTFESSMIRARLDQAKANPRFYYYFWGSPLGRGLMASIATRTAVSGIRGSDLVQLKVPMPPLPIQRRIAAILSSYDDLIENNTRRIAILEGMAQAIYREWFVHFRFPGHEQARFVDFRLGKIPEEWEVASILDVPYFRFVRENVRFYEGTKRYFATADVSGIEIVGEGIEYAYEDKPSRAQKKPVVNSVWFARMKETYKVLPFTAVNEHLAASSLLSSGFAGFEATNPNTFGFLFFTIDSDEFHERKDLYCTGATQMSLNNEGLGRIELTVPDESTVTAFGRIAQPMVDQILILQARNSVLRRTRDLLLPKLVSGEIEVDRVRIDQ